MSVSIYLFIYFPVTVYLQLRFVNVSNKRIWMNEWMKTKIKHNADLKTKITAVSAAKTVL